MEPTVLAEADAGHVRTMQVLLNGFEVLHEVLDYADRDS
jgi:hypothetical protein